jgi:putative hydrolase of HD superfamily
MTAPRLTGQLAFLVEADKLKNVLRRTLVTSGARRENSAEHSWHLALCAVVLVEYAAEPVDLPRAMKMLVVHNLVEIDAGDTFAFDTAANFDKLDRERAAAERIFGLLPPDLAGQLRALWEEFEAHSTPEARFAHAVDRIQPFLQNLHTEGGTWRLYRPTRAQVMERMDPVRTALPALWPTVLAGVEEFFSKQGTR